MKDKQGRTEQLVGVLGGALGDSEVLQSGDLRLKLIGRAAQPLSSRNITANRFEVTVRDLSSEEAERVSESAAEVERTGVVNYFDSQRFGFLKHGQGFIARHLLRGDWESALKAFLATPSELDRSDDAKVKTFWRDHWGEWQLRAPQAAGKRYAPILRRLREDPRDFKGAFLHIDRRLRMMALFELQSFLWNEGVKRYLGARIPRRSLESHVPAARPGLAHRRPEGTRRRAGGPARARTDARAVAGPRLAAVLQARGAPAVRPPREAARPPAAAGRAEPREAQGEPLLHASARRVCDPGGAARPVVRHRERPSGAAFR